MWIAYALGSAGFAALTAVLAKAGITRTSSNVATLVRTGVVLVAAWLLVLAIGSWRTIGTLDATTLVFLGLSGLATGASWLCYFRALQLGEVSRVVPIDRSSIVLTVLLAIVLLGETDRLGVRLTGIALVGAGTYLMIDVGPSAPPAPAAAAAPASGVGAASRHGWLFFAVLAAVFAALTSILGKVGITDVESNLGTAIRTVVVLVMAWVVVAVTGERHAMREIPRRDLAFIVLSGLATGASWLCYWRALQEGPASLVVPIDKLSVVATVVLARVCFGERLTRRGLVGLTLVVAGTLWMVIG